MIFVLVASSTDSTCLRAPFAMLNLLFNASRMRPERAWTRYPAQHNKVKAGGHPLERALLVKAPQAKALPWAKRRKRRTKTKRKTKRQARLERPQQKSSTRPRREELMIG